MQHRGVPAKAVMMKSFRTKPLQSPTVAFVKAGTSSQIRYRDQRVSAGASCPNKADKDGRQIGHIIQISQGTGGQTASTIPGQDCPR